MNSPVAGVRLLLLSATGAVRQQVMRLALVDERVAQVTAPTRRPLTPHTKLRNPVTDFSALPDAPSVWDADAVICDLLLNAEGPQFDASDRDHVRRLAVVTLLVSDPRHKHGRRFEGQNPARGDRLCSRLRVQTHKPLGSLIWL
jgi:hypothetical protein